jgi:DnaJ-class molecular chaperone
MASDADAPENLTGGSVACGPCRGTGRLVSSFGGEPHEVTCPWCEGGGRFIARHDAQAAGAPAESGPQP